MLSLFAFLRCSLPLVRAGLHAAVVVTVSFALLLLFLLWSVLQVFEEHEPAARAAAKDALRTIARLD
jgi:hypothetical protein